MEKILSILNPMSPDLIIKQEKYLLIHVDSTVLIKIISFAANQKVTKTLKIIKR